MKRNFKVGILTQPLHDNYGGLLQAYALSKKLEELGHNPIIINRKFNKRTLIRNFLSTLKRKITSNTKYNLSKSEKAIISKNTIEFRNKYIPNLTFEINDNEEMYNFDINGYDAFVVGSDQCWRPRYSPNIYNYFLDFLGNKSDIKRITYAASFGTSKWEFSEKETKICKKLAQKFDAVSVREDSAVDLSKKHLNIKAKHVLDPTMLWPREFYDKMTEVESIPPSGADLKAYILDMDEKTSNVINYIEKKLNLRKFEVMPLKRLSDSKPINILEYQYPSPLKWLKGYQDAKFVIADSFHGIVFSIIYKVPFVAIGNEKRGMARFTSLLKLFNLENRLITDFSIEKINKVLESEIDWNHVNIILEQKRNESINFLRQNLQ